MTELRKRDTSGEALMGIFWCSRGCFLLFCRFADGLRPEGWQQAFAEKVEIGERAGREQPVGIFLKTTVTNLREAKDMPDDAESMFHATADPEIYAITSALYLAYDALVTVTPVREVLRLRGMLSAGIALALVGRVARDPGLLAMEKIGQDLGVMDIGGSGDYRMDDLGLAVDPDMRLYPLQGFMPKTARGPSWSGACRDRVSRPCSSLTMGRRRWGVDDGGSDDRAVRDVDALRFEMAVDLAKDLLAQMMILEEMVELQDRNFIRHGFLSQINAGETAL